LPVNSSPSPITNYQSSTLSDKYLIRIIPSCQIFKFCQDRGEIENPSYGIIDNASNDRYITSFAGDKISEMCNIKPKNRLQGTEKATVKNYRQLVQTVQAVHSIHHASSDLGDPLLSALLLGDGEITLGELLTPGWRMPHLSDVFLSCCETGLGVPEKLTDDIFTLSAGFLCAGARNVVSTLWTVNDLATSLFCLFYYQYRQQNQDRVTALRLAQQDLRNITADELKKLYLGEIADYINQLKKQTKKQIEMNPENQELVKSFREINATQQQINQLKGANRDSKPFESPFYWAGFICQGLR
ncbi:MAG: CHAT domain-containing protein, partial [Sphaerospermopsis kisseleviana]